MREAFITQPIRRLYMHYLVPTLIAMLSSSMYVLADVYFISVGAGSAGLAALNIAMPLFSLFSAIGLCFGVGGATIMAIAEGNHDADLRNKVFTLSIAGMSILGLLCSIFGYLFTDQLALLFGSDEALLPYAGEYMRIVLAGSIIFVLMYSASVLIRGDHAPKTAMRITLFGNISNIVLDYVFVITFGWGIGGAAIATVIGALFVVLGMGYHFLFGNHQARFVKNAWDLAALKRTLKNGFGSALMEISIAVVVIIFNFVIMRYADALFLAAFSIITNIAYVCRGLLNGFAQAAQPIISTNYGAKEKARVASSLKTALFWSTACAALLYLLFLLFPRMFASIFASGDQALIALAAKGIRYYFISLLFTAPVIVIMYYFQSIERGNMATVVALCKGFVFVLLGLVILMLICKLDGIWLATPFAEGLALLLCIALLRRSSYE